jgi:hypothetical protein
VDDDDAVVGAVGALAVCRADCDVRGTKYEEIASDETDPDDVGTWRKSEWMRNNPGQHVIYVRRIPKKTNGVPLIPAEQGVLYGGKFLFRHTHIGQFKLYVAAARFIHELLRMPGDVAVVYVGAAPGFLSLAAFVHERVTRVVLIDPRFGDKAFDPMQVLSRYKGEWVSKLRRKVSVVAGEYNGASFVPHGANERVVLISDIRVTTDDAAILADQKRQLLWSKQFHASSLKWRAVGESWASTWFPSDGQVFHQPFRAPFSAEVRVLLEETRGDQRLYANEVAYAEAQFFNRHCTDEVAFAYMSYLWGKVSPQVPIEYASDCVMADMLIEGHTPEVGITPLKRARRARGTSGVGNEK